MLATVMSNFENNSANWTIETCTMGICTNESFNASLLDTFSGSLIDIVPNDGAWQNINDRGWSGLHGGDD